MAAVLHGAYMAPPRSEPIPPEDALYFSSSSGQQEEVVVVPFFVGGGGFGSIMSSVGKVSVSVTIGAATHPPSLFLPPSLPPFTHIAPPPQTTPPDTQANGPSTTKAQTTKKKKPKPPAVRRLVGSTFAAAVAQPDRDVVVLLTRWVSVGICECICVCM